MKKTNKTDTARVALLGLLFALSIALAWAEQMIPPLPFMPPGVKLGLSNIVTMYCLFFLGRRSAFTIVVLKSGFVFLIRGVTAFLLSLTGGVLATLVMMLLLLLSARSVSYLVISIAGAVTHNLGQLIAASFLLGTGAVVAYLPLLLVSGVIMGNVTGALLRLVMPAFNALNRQLPHNAAAGNKEENTRE
jgi:heptaprenyl diphosphate synthase